MTTWLTTQPSVQFRRHGDFYRMYDGSYLALCLAAVAIMAATGWQGLTDRYGWWMAWSFPLAVHIVVLCNVFIHNCTHGNFPRPINRLVGELCGMVVLTRYASWEIVHRRHHKYSDDPERDPHPVDPNFLKFSLRTFARVEEQLQQQYFDLHGGVTRKNRRHERWRAVLSFGASAALIYTWYRFLGAPIFLAMFLPLFAIGVLHILHFNWVTHDPTARSGQHRPVNTDSGIYWFLNRIWFGIYCHANHHRYASLFDPRKLDASPGAAPGGGACAMCAG